MAREQHAQTWIQYRLLGRPGRRKRLKSQVMALYSVQKKTVAPVHAISDNLSVCQGKTRGVWNSKQSQSGSDGGFVQGQLRNATEREGLYG